MTDRTRRTQATSSLRMGFIAAAALGVCAIALADDYGPLPPIGSSNVSIADPLVHRPATTPCEVALFTDETFNDFSPRDFAYAPPAGCVGPWAKVVLLFDLSVTAGRQFDRTSTMWLGGVNIFFGTTAEPTATLAPSWHVERDLTDYTALLSSAQAGRVLIGNVVDTTYTGIIHGSAKLQFYPLSTDPAPFVADVVLPLGSDAVGATVDLATPTATLSKTFTLPTNIQQAYLDVIAQSQGSDEFWWTCMPDDVAAITGDCPGTAFREVEITLDGTPAGVAPVYPWVYTGGFQPLLWIPIPGVQTLNFPPYRVDLSPFAGVLSDGQPHTVALSVFNTHDHFSTTATLLLNLDAGSTQVTGAITENTLTGAPTPVVNSTIGSDGLGTVTVDSTRSFRIAGYAQTSHGRVDSVLEQTFTFNTTSSYATVSPTVTQWTVAQNTSVDTTLNASSASASTGYSTSLRYPFLLTLPFNSQSGSLITADFDQQYLLDTSTLISGVPFQSSSLSNHVNTHHAAASANRHSSQDYESHGFDGSCYSRVITTAANKLTSVVDDVPCDRIFANGFDGAD